MSDQMLIKGVPERIQTWIETEHRQRMMTKKQFVIEMLEMAYNKETGPGLFDEIASRPVPIPDTTPFTFIDLVRGDRRTANCSATLWREVHFHQRMGQELTEDLRALVWRYTRGRHHEDQAEGHP